MQRFGQKLRALRTHHGLTLREMADALGYTSYSYLASLEVGRKKPTAEFVMKAAQLFGVTTDQLLWDHLDIPGADEATPPGEA